MDSAVPYDSTPSSTSAGLESSTKRKTKRLIGIYTGGIGLKGKTPLHKVNWLECIPAEVLFEIFSHCTPLALIHLSYTDKYMHATLTPPTRGYDVIFRQARENIPGLPDLPPGFTERQYAIFMFIDTCQRCGKSANGRRQPIGVRVRLCEKCRQQHCISGQVAKQILGEWGLLRLVPGHLRNGANHEEISEYKHGSVFLRTDVNALHQERAAIRDTEVLQAFDEARLKETMIISTSTAELRAFRDAQPDLKPLRLSKDAQIRNKNNDFLQHFEALGYDWEDLSYRNCDRVLRTSGTFHIPFLKCTWEEARPVLEAAANEKRERRLDEEAERRNIQRLKSLFSRLYWALPTERDRNTYLPVDDFLKLPGVKAHINSRLLGEEFDVLVNQNLPAIESDVDVFHRRMRADMVERWCRKYGCPELAEGKDDEWRSGFLSLAIVVFHEQGHSSDTHPVTSHHYTTLFKRHVFSTLTMESDQCGCRTSMHPRLAYNWSHYLGRLDVHSDHVQAMKDTLDTFDLDWRCTTLAHLEVKGGWMRKFEEFLDQQHMKAAMGVFEWSTWLGSSLL